MLEITQKHDFEAKNFLGLGGGTDHLKASQAISQPRAQYIGHDPKNRENFFFSEMPEIWRKIFVGTWYWIDPPINQPEAQYRHREIGN